MGSHDSKNALKEDSRVSTVGSEIVQRTDEVRKCGSLNSSGAFFGMSVVLFYLTNYTN